VTAQTLPTSLSTAVPANVAPDGSSFTNNDPTWLLARRATSAATPELVKEIKAIGVTAWLNDQLAPGRIDDSAYEQIATRFPFVNDPIWSIFNNKGEAPSQVKGQVIKASTLAEHISRMLWSKRQLQAQMVDFWANHLNVQLILDAHEDGRTHYQGVLRKFALGKFSDLLASAIRHPAMLRYLNNDTSTFEHPNENLGRELLELHTLGVGNYSEDDVLAATRVLTGLSSCRETGRYEYKAWFHWTGPVQVLGWSHANDSQDTGYQVAAELLAYLALRPETAQRVCRKIAQQFVSDNPPQSLIDRMAISYSSNDTAIAPVLRLMFTSPEFANSHGQITRRPMESFLSSIRALGLQIDPMVAGTTGYEGILTLAVFMGRCGHAPMSWGPPDGFAQDANSWASTSAMANRWNGIKTLAQDTYPPTLGRPLPLLQRVHPTTLPATHGAFLDNLCLRFFGRTMTATDRAAALAFAAVTDSTPLLPTSAAVTIGLGDLLALLLNSPYHVYR
jgi:uncharacterized protein (DUF1800 family)/phage tail protein X